ncbi:MAG: WD40 repeat domain-containing protein [Chloroflexi bacterium]|nr:WD40 repeat domain-containing protein [Chloroflexota bacterium]MCC6895324.1 WD40 repeat domain-containing protein [Anaerolineae bacterium]
MEHKPRIFTLLILICTLLAAYGVTAQNPPTPYPTPTLTASPPAPDVTITPPTPIPTAIVASKPLALPALQPITRANAAAIEHLFTLQCQLVGEPGSRPGILAAAFSPVENRLAAAAYGAVCVFDLTKPDTEPLIITTFSAAAVAFTPDGESLFTLHNGDDLYKWNPRTGEELPTRLEGISIFASPQILSISPDGSLMANGGRYGFRLWDMATEQVVFSLQTVGITTYLVWKPDGSGLITNEGIYRIYPDLRLFREAELAAPSRDGGAAVGGAAGELLAYRSPEGVRVIQIDSLEVVASPDGIDEEVLAFSPADPLLLMGAAHGGFGFWDVERDEWVSNFPSNDFTIPNSATFNSDGTLLAVGVKDGVSLWGVPQ